MDGGPPLRGKDTAVEVDRGRFGKLNGSAFQPRSHIWALLRRIDLYFGNRKRQFRGPPRRIDAAPPILDQCGRPVPLNAAKDLLCRSLAPISSARRLSANAEVHRSSGSNRLTEGSDVSLLGSNKLPDMRCEPIDPLVSERAAAVRRRAASTRALHYSNISPCRLCGVDVYIMSTDTPKGRARGAELWASQSTRHEVEETGGGEANEHADTR
ncbi:hypothetical protein THAOC_24215 [Thalassiosira oceanica]|uniref:Uncharacterized protein n=1 Tax=Thalassiosira oceanica TaxID=159749 RepID=K0RQB5_THAOC|nr:hypothetical protein THAOC_24215 [Thalassiosira oceanica]|eukprot:EJK55978.1 hypothetical protein THAOC_24215 [Thalassiosira oceanica]